MKKKQTGIILVLLALVYIWTWESEESYIGRQVGLGLPRAVSSEHSDSHGGFHGDGLRLDVLQFSQTDGEAVESRIKSRGDLWNKGAFDEHLGGILYHGGPAQSGDWPRYPENAYCFFKDRHSNQEDPIDQRHSWNYTAALYDADTHILYYLEFDT